MKKSESNVDSNHVKEAKEILSGKSTTSTTTSSFDKIDEKRNPQSDKLDRRQTSQSSTSDQGELSDLQFRLPGSPRVGPKPVRSDVTEVGSRGIVSRILANVGNSNSSSGVREEGAGKAPGSLATRSPKTKPKPLSLAKVVDIGNSDKLKSISDKSEGISSNRKDPRDHNEDNESAPRSIGAFKSRDALSKVHDNKSSDYSSICSSTEDGRGRVKNQIAYATGGDEARESIDDKRAMGKSTPLGSSTDGNVNKKGNNPICSKRELTAKNTCSEKRESLVKQKRSSLGVADGKDSSGQSDDRREICCPPLPASLSRDSGISSPSVDDVKPIDQRGDEPKDNEGQIKALRVERGETTKACTDDEAYSNSGKVDIERARKEKVKENIKQTSLSTTKEEEPLVTHYNEPPQAVTPSQAVDEVNYSQEDLSSNPPTVTHSVSEYIYGQEDTAVLESISRQRETNLVESIPCQNKANLDESIPRQGETNRVISHSAPIGGQADKTTVTALRIDPLDTHALRESGGASSPASSASSSSSPSSDRIDIDAAQPAISVDSTSADATITTTITPAIRIADDFADQAPFSSATRDAGSERFAESCDSDEVTLNTNKAILISTNQIYPSDSPPNVANTALGSQADLATSSAQEQQVHTTSSDVAGKQSSSLTTTHTTEATTTNATNDSVLVSTTSTSLRSSSLTSGENCDERTITDHDNRSHDQNHRDSDPGDRSERESERDEARAKEEENQDDRGQQHEITLYPNCCHPLSDTNFEKPEITGVEGGSCNITHVCVDIEPSLEATVVGGVNIAVQNQTNFSPSKPVEDGDALARIESEALDTLPPLKPKRAKLTFRDINIQEVISLETDSSSQKLKGILKSKSHDCISQADESVRENGKERLHSSRSVSFKKTHTKSTFSYYNAAFEGEVREEPSRRPSLADVVSHIMRTNAVADIEEEDDNSHPYGRDNSLTDLINGKRRETYNMDAGKMIVWFALAIMIVSLAGVIIFMSESYNLTHKAEEIPLPLDDTTLSHS